MQRTAQRIRKKKKGEPDPKQPKTLADIELPESSKNIKRHRIYTLGQ